MTTGAVSTFSDVLSAQLKVEPGRPLVTFYDNASGERVELSVTTYANWVAKAASLLVEEHDLERGDTLRIDLPPHWLATVFLGAAWMAGLTVTDDDNLNGESPDAVVCGPDELPTWAERAGELPVLACSLLPLGVRFKEPVPPDVHDVGIDIWSQPDSFIPWDPPGPDDLAHDLGGVAVTHGQLWAAAAVGNLITDGGRLLSEANPASPPGIATFAEPLLRRGSVVLVARAGRERLEATYVAERATARFPA